MSDDLLVHYNRELSYIRKLAHEFAEAHPDVAPQLGLDAQTVQDPYVERLLEGVAYLTARVRKKLDDDFPELAEALLNLLYPHYLAPLPALSIAQFALDPGQSGMVAGYPLPRGAKLESEDVGGEPCQFRTAYALRLFPLRVTAAELAPLSRKPVVPLRDEALATLRIRLETLGPDGPLSKLDLDRLRFYIAGESVHANALYETVFNDVVGVALASGVDDPEAVRLPDDCLHTIGFAADEALLPYGPRSFPGYRLLSEYFALPEKFRFFDLSGLAPQVRARFTSAAEIVFYLRKKHDDLQRNVDADTFRLGCTPIVNLFEQRADPFRLTQTRSRYHLVPDVRRTHAMEIYSVDRVSATGGDGRTIPVHPFYSLSHAVERREQRAYWYASRRPAGTIEGRLDPGTEVDLTFVDLGFSPAAPADWTVDVVTTCLNRDLPAQLPFGGGRPQIKVVAGGPLAPIRLLTPFTPTRRPALRHGTLWRLISHLSLNHLSLVGGEQGAAALREILTLYDASGSAESAARIQSIQQVQTRRATARLHTASASGFCRGIEVTIDFDEQRFSDRGLFLFATVLERFLALYCSINSYSQLVARSKQREGVVHRWPPRAAEKPLL